MRQPDITLAHEELGWEPQVRLEEGLSRQSRISTYQLFAREQHLLDYFAGHGIDSMAQGRIITSIA